MHLLAMIFVSIGHLWSGTCPVINGTFQRIDKEGGVYTIRLSSGLVRGVAFYNFDLNGRGPRLVADGMQRLVTYHGERASVQVSCEGSTVELNIQEVEGTAETIRYTSGSDGGVQVDGTIAAMNGIYKKAGSPSGNEPAM
jgi:hypothetical protein